MTTPYRYHVFCCTQRGLDKKDYCRDQGSEEVLAELERQLQLRGLEQTVEATPCGCLGLCARGPVMVVYPDGVWYASVTLRDVEELVEQHFVKGQPLERLRLDDVDQLRGEIEREKQRSRAQQAAEQEAGVLPDRLRSLASDFQAGRAFLSAVELDLFSAVGDGCTAEEAAEVMGTDPRATQMLLDALAALDLVNKDGQRYRNSPDTHQFLRKGSEDDARAAIMNRVNMWDRWTTLTECVREGGSVGHELGSGPAATQAYIAATHKIASLAAPTLVEALKLPGLQRVLDVGGGSGAYTVALLNAYPDARAELLDLPAVTRIATRYVREAGLEHRVTMRGGNFMVDPLGAGFDLVLLSYVMHLRGPEPNKRLLAKAFDALEPGGRVVINDYVLGADRTSPRAAALYALNMLVSSHDGDVFSLEQYRQWLQGAGFVDIRKVAVLGPTDIVTARKP